MYSVEVTNNGGYQFKARSKDYEMTIDTAGKGMTPPDTLLASLASCVGVYIRKYCEGSQIDPGAFSVKAEADFNQEKPVCFRSIRIRIALGNPLLDERRKKSLLDFVKNCPVHNTLEAKPEVTMEIAND